VVLDTLKCHKYTDLLGPEHEEVRGRITSLSPRERELLDAIVGGSPPRWWPNDGYFLTDRRSSPGQPDEQNASG